MGEKKKTLKSNKPDNTLSKSAIRKYQSLLKDIKERILSSQIKAALSINRELIILYHAIGLSILQKQTHEGWGAKTIDRLSRDLKTVFPRMEGLSPRNLQLMVQFAKSYEGFEIAKQPVSQIPWGHNILLMQKLDDPKARLWYAQKTIEHGWSRNVLLHWIDSRLVERDGKATTNFQHTLPAPQSDLAHQTLKDPYLFDFLSLRDKHDERELETGLIDHIQKFLIELGQGFAFLGRQYPITVSSNDYFLDLLFYHVKLRCYVVVELKARAFKPEDAGKLNFYLSAVDDILRHPSDNPSIGLLLCKTQDKVIAEYALRDIKKPLGVAEYETKIIESLPENFKGSLPTIEELEAELTQEEP